jgi:hypothetical protein
VTVEDEAQGDDDVAALRPRPARYEITRFAMLRGLGAIYFVAFVAAAQQLGPLVGPDGLLPAEALLAPLRRDGWSAIVEVPTLFLAVPATDASLSILAWVGAALALSVALGASNAVLMTALWALHLSIVHVGQTFWAFGWELLLAETGFLAIFVAPLRSLAPFARTRAPATSIVMALHRWLLFRVMLGAGLIKLRGDPCWRELTCLDTFYETQPLPSPLSPLWHFAPTFVRHGGVLINHVVELIVPFAYFAPPRPRAIAGLVTIAFQLMLIAGGNLSYLNWLTIVIALGCFDDEHLTRVVPRSLSDKLARTGATDRATVATTVVLAVVIGMLSVPVVLNMLSRGQQMNASFDPFEIVNTYGAFGSVETVRDELVIEGSLADDPHDEAAYRAYELPCAPGDPRRRPCFVAPYPMRLDWQIWFAAMHDDVGRSPWLVHLVWQILHGEGTALTLFSRVPFDRPPRWLRIRRFRYRLSATRDVWWTREVEDDGWMRPIDRDDARLREYVEAMGW